YRHPLIRMLPLAEMQLVADRCQAWLIVRDPKSWSAARQPHCISLDLAISSNSPWGPNGGIKMIFPHSRTLWISLLAALVTASSLSLQSKAQAVPAQSYETSRRSLSNSVILQGGTHAQTMQRLHVVRQYALPALRSNPRAILGQS